MARTRVLIASSSPETRTEIEQQISACDSIHVIGTVGRSQEVLELTARLKPDVLVFHAASCGKPHIELLFQLQELHPEIKVLALECSPQNVQSYFISLAAWGLRGCICEWRNSSELIDAVCTLGHGDFYLCPKASHALVDAYRNMIHRDAPEEVRI